MVKIPMNLFFCMIFERICDILEKHAGFQSYLLSMKS